MQTPSREASPPWPLKLRVASASLFFARSSGVRNSAAIYVSMAFHSDDVYRCDGEALCTHEIARGTVVPWAALTLILSILAFLCSPANTPPKQSLVTSYASPNQQPAEQPAPRRELFHLREELTNRLAADGFAITEEVAKMCEEELERFEGRVNVAFNKVKMRLQATGGTPV